MSDDPHYRPDYRIIIHRYPALRGFGCIGCLITIFIVGGIVGLLWSGWRSLLGF